MLSANCLVSSPTELSILTNKLDTGVFASAVSSRRGTSVIASSGQVFAHKPHWMQLRMAECRIVFKSCNAVPLLGIWVIVAVALGTYRRPGVSTLLRTWIVAVPIALVVRSLWVGSPSEITPFLTFLAVGLSFTLLFLAIGRVLARLVADGLGTARRRSA